MVLVIFVAVIVMAALGTVLPVDIQILFPEVNRKYSYVLKTNVSCGTVTPSESDSYWILEGRLLVQAYDKRIRFQLDDLKASVYSKNHGYFSYKSAEAAIQLKKPWEADYPKEGRINYMYIDSEPVWATNIKRALTINFQLKKDTGTYTNEESCLYASCVVIYIAKGNVIRKYNSLQFSSITSERSWSSVPITRSSEYDGRGVSDTIVTAERIYELDDRKGLMSLVLRGDFQYKTHNHILSVSSELSLYYDGDTLVQKVEPLELNYTTSLQYEAHDYNDPSNSIRNKNQTDLKNKTYEILLRIASKGIDADNVVRNATLVHNLDFVDLLNTMSQLNYQSLHKLFEDMVLGTSYDIETSRNIFLEVLPHIRTNACAVFIKYLVLENKDKIEDATILSLIRKLPFNVANHSQSLLEELEVFTKLGLDFSQEIRHAAILSFATLVHKTKEAWAVKQDYFDNIVVKYFRMYSDCPKYIDRLIWLQGLCNIGHSAVSYTSTINLDTFRDRHERLWAALAGYQNTGRPYTVLETTLPILIDEHEHIQLKIAALHTFLSSDIKASDFIYVHNYIKNCNNNQLKRFWYTTVKSLENSQGYHEYRAASYYVPFIASQVSNPDSTYWATNNYIISTQDDSGAAALQIMSVGEALTALPVMVAIKLSTGGRRSHHIAAYIIAEGVSTNMFKKVHNLNAKELNVDKLLEVLTKMKVQAVAPEKVHIDLVLKIHDKTVYATHINQTRFESWNGEDLTKSVEDFLRFGSHINQQIVYYPFQMDVNLPTELGTPIRLQSTIVSFTSIRGNLTAPSTQDLTWRNDLHIRYQGTSVTSLSTDGPLLQSEHTALIQQSMVAHLPMKFDVTVSPMNRFFELTWPNPGAQHGGVAMHSRARISMESAKGRDSYTVSAGDSIYNVDETGLFFDCEQPMTGAEVVEKLLTSKSNGYDFLTSLQPSLIILNSILVITSPTSGSCGLILPPRRLMQAGDNLLEFKFQMEDLQLDFDDGIKMKLAHSLGFRENKEDGDVYLNVTGYTKLESSSGNLTLEFLLAGKQPHAVDPTKRLWKFCLQEQDISHAASDQDITTHPASYEGQLTLTYLPGDVTYTCPTTGSQLMIQYKGIPTDVFGNLERYYEVKAIGKKLPKLNIISQQIDFGGQSPLGQLLNNLDKRPLNVTAVIKEKNGLASISLNNGPEIQFKSDHFAWLLDNWSNMQIMKKFGIYRECRLQESIVQTLQGSMDQLPSVQCAESLALADCTASPRFAVLRLKKGGVKVYTGGSYVTIEGLGAGATVTINGERQCDGDCVYPEGEPIYDFKVSRAGDVIKVHSRLSGVQVYYRPIETVVLVPHSYINTACGSCIGQHYYNLC